MPIARRRLRWARRSDCTAETTLATMPLTPTSAHSASNEAASSHSRARGMASEPDSICTTRPNSTGSRNCRPATTRLARASITAIRRSPASSPITRAYTFRACTTSSHPWLAANFGQAPQHAPAVNNSPGATNSDCAATVRISRDPAFAVCRSTPWMALPAASIAFTGSPRWSR